MCSRTVRATSVAVGNPDLFWVTSKYASPSDSGCKVLLAPPDGEGPQAGLIGDKEGNFYSVTGAGDVSNLGTVFKLAPTGVENVLFSLVGLTAKLPNRF
jgi:hypothetical protein